MQCDFIAHSKDVDFGILASNFRMDLIHKISESGLTLTHR
jgi:hypothetical protein